MLMKQGFTFDDVILIPSYNHYESRKVVSTKVQDKLGKLELDLPIMTANMDTITESEMANYIASKGGIGVIHRFMSQEESLKQYKAVKKNERKVFMSVGTSKEELARFSLLKEGGCEYFCVDVAHAHAKYVGSMIKQMREIGGDNICIMAGNVSTYAGADYLASKGADIIKVGIGPGSVCTTRIKTGHGVPQLTAIEDCARVDRSIVADGGIRYPGDVVKALAFGADFVMIGGLLSGTHYTPGTVHNNSYKIYRGMASKEVADEKLNGLTDWKTAEGVCTQVPYKNEKETDAIISDLIGGLRSGLTYSGSITIKELQRKLNFMLITPAGAREALPHKTL